VIAVLGPGGVGGLVAAALARAGEEVVVVAREETAARIAECGIEVRSVRLGDFVARPAAVAELREPVGALLVATKAVGLEAALRRILAPAKLVVPLLNGLDHVAALRARFGAERVCAAAIRVESTRVEPGVVSHTSQFLRIDLAPRSPATEQFARGLERARIQVTLSDSEADVMWGKLVRLNALACTTSAWSEPLGPIRDDPARRAALERCVAEAAAVARAEGAAVDPAATMAELDEAHAELRSSMQRDIEAGREPELDAIPGAVLRAAARHGLACPTIEELMGTIAARLGER
jgi:2-dehydropantoate 2-reductase